MLIGKKITVSSESLEVEDSSFLISRNVGMITFLNKGDNKDENKVHFIRGYVFIYMTFSILEASSLYDVKREACY